MTPEIVLTFQVGLVVLGVAAAWVVATRRLPTPWSAIGWGALAFPLSQVARYALVIPVTLLLTQLLGPDLGAANIVLLVVTSGLFEETTRWVVLRFWARRLRSWEHGIGFGLGHGGSEAILLMGLAAVNGVVLLRTADALRGTVANTAPEQLAGFDAQVEALRSLTLLDAAPGIWERILAVVVHVAMSLLVLRAVRTGRWQWWALAVVLHCVINAVTVGTASLSGGNVLLTESLLTVIALALLWTVLRGPLSRRTVADPSPDAPVAVRADEGPA